MALKHVLNDVLKLFGGNIFFCPIKDGVSRPKGSCAPFAFIYLLLFRPPIGSDSSAPFSVTINLDYLARSVPPHSKFIFAHKCERSRSFVGTKLCPMQFLRSLACMCMYVDLSMPIGHGHARNHHRQRHQGRAYRWVCSSTCVRMDVSLHACMDGCVSTNPMVKLLRAQLAVHMQEVNISWLWTFFEAL